MSAVEFHTGQGVLVDKLLSAEELAELIGVPLGTVYRWNYAGGGPPMIKVGRHARYRPGDVDRWLDEKARHSASSGRVVRDSRIGRATRS